MSAFPSGERQRAEAPGLELPESMSLFAHIEGLIGEEAALLAIPAHERTSEHHNRLRELTGELDRVWESLVKRAKTRGGGEAPQSA
jgi:hypothetical protein